MKAPVLLIALLILLPATVVLADAITCKTKCGHASASCAKDARDNLLKAIGCGTPSASIVFDGGKTVVAKSTTGPCYARYKLNTDMQLFLRCTDLKTGFDEAINTCMATSGLAFHTSGWHEWTVSTCGESFSKRTLLAERRSAAYQAETEGMAVYEEMAAIAAHLLAVEDITTVDLSQKFKLQYSGGGAVSYCELVVVEPRLQKKYKVDCKGQ